MHQKKHIVNNNGSLVSQFYILDDTKYKIIATKSTGWSAIDCIDTVLNIKTGKTKDFMRKQLYHFTRR